MRNSVLFSSTAMRRLAILTIAALALQSISCGTLIHPDRCGQRSGRLDPSIVMLDGLALLVFIVPGVIGFVVDFATGAIYLPERYAPANSQQAARANAAFPGMTVIQTDPVRLNQAQIESIVRERTGKAVDLGDPNVVIRPVSSPGQANAALSWPGA